MSAKTTIYFIRHGECAGNRERRIRGCVDFPLNKNGIKQARALAERMKELGIGRIVTSPLSRAVMTAEILGLRLGLSPVVKDGFRNICFGSWENRLQSEIIEEFPEMWKTWLTARRRRGKHRRGAPALAARTGTHRRGVCGRNYRPGIAQGAAEADACRGSGNRASLLLAAAS